MVLRSLRWRAHLAIFTAHSGIQKLGVQIKEIDRGLVDFPHVRDGQEVFLCWELGEEDIEYWHELDTGYVGREKL